ncbi:MAG: hypothetical protein AAFQ17_03820, partial [Pseudomonadota bacterium]
PIEVDGAILEAVEGVRPISSVSNLAVEGIVTKTANALQSLFGTPSATTIQQGTTSDRIDTTRIWEIAESLSRVRGGVADVWQPEGLSGFSLRYSDAAGGLGSVRGLDVVIESLVRQGIMIIQVENPKASDDGRQVSGIRFKSGTGTTLPGWLERVGPRVLMGERPVDVEELELSVVIEFDDGSSETRRVRIQGETGEIQNVEERRSELRPPMFEEQFRPTYALTESQTTELACLLKK